MVPSTRNASTPAALPPKFPSDGAVSPNSSRLPKLQPVKHLPALRHRATHLQKALLRLKKASSSQTSLQWSHPMLLRSPFLPIPWTYPSHLQQVIQSIPLAMVLVQLPVLQGLLRIPLHLKCRNVPRTGGVVSRSNFLLSASVYVHTLNTQSTWPSIYIYIYIYTYIYIQIYK